MKTRILLGILVFGTSAAHAQDSTRVVRGRVVDERTGQPVPMAVVHLRPRVADADSAGFFRLCGLPPGAAVVQMLAEGYQERGFPVQVSAQDSTTLLVRAQPAMPGEPSTRRIGHGPSRNAHRAIFVVDGERVFHDPAGCGRPRPGEPRLDTLSAGEIENIEIIKGPAAVERFGPAARYGVVVIATRRAGRRPAP